VTGQFKYLGAKMAPPPLGVHLSLILLSAEDPRLVASSSSPELGGEREEGELGVILHIKLYIPAL
jgi:hypothetical protein